MRLAVVLLAALLVPAVALAQNPNPSPTQSSFDPVIVGTSNGMLIGDGYHVTIRSPNGTPLGNVTVSVNFQQGVFPYSNQPSPTFTDCASLIISQVTNGTGQAFFHPRLGGYVNSAVMAVKANGIFMTQIAGRSTDLNANGATDAFDLAHFRTNFLNNPSAPETDYDESGATDIADFSIFRQVFLNDAPGAVCN